MRVATRARRIQKIALVEPKSTHIPFFEPVHLPRGSVLLGTILRNLGYDVEVFIESMGGIDYERLHDADLVGISALTATAPQSYRIADFCRGYGIPVVLGGVHVNFLPDEGLQYAPYVIRGEGEYAFPELLSCLNEGGGLSKVGGLSWWDDGVPTHNFDRPLLGQEALDRNPFPDYSLVYGIGRRVSWVCVQTQRGCPHRCNFCTVWKADGNLVRTYSNEWILGAIKYYQQRFGTNSLFFADDIFNLPSKKKQGLFEGMLSRGLQIQWSAQVRQEVADDEQFLELAAKSGGTRLLIGFESPRQETLDYYNKRARVSIEEVCRKIQKHGLAVHGMFIFGAPTDTIKTLDEILAVARENADVIHTMQVMVLSTGPGAETYREFLAHGGKVLESWDRFDGHHAPHTPIHPSLARYELVHGAADTMRKFYSFRHIKAQIFRGNLFDAYVSLLIWWNLRRWFVHNDTYLASLRLEVEGQKDLSVGSSVA